MTITVLTKHDNHEVRIHLTKGQGPHYAALRCTNCNRHIQWLNFNDTHRLEELGVTVWNNTQDLKI
jgi:hypothetical protein